MTDMTPLGDPIGAQVPDWRAPPRPSRIAMDGRYCRLEPLAVEHTTELYRAHSQDTDGRMWTYVPNGPYGSETEFGEWVWEAAASSDPMHFAIVTDRGAVGTASYLRIAPSAGSIEVGYITYSPVLQRTRAATEAMYLMMRWAFEAGYRRYEWKCNSLNAPSRRAAQRLGLSFEGVFRQALIVKGRNRDTAWYGAIDSDWPAIRAAMEDWLDPANFDEAGRQVRSLSALTEGILVNRASACRRSMAGRGWADALHPLIGIHAASSSLSRSAILSRSSRWSGLSTKPRTTGRLSTKVRSFGGQVDGEHEDDSARKIVAACRCHALKQFGTAQARHVHVEEQDVRTRCRGADQIFERLF